MIYFIFFTVIKSASSNESWRETLETVNERKPQMWSFFFSVSHLNIGWSGFDFWTKSQSCTSAFWFETEENHSLLSNDIQAFNFFPKKQIFPVIDTKSKKQCLHENWTRPAPTGFILKASSLASNLQFLSTITIMTERLLNAHTSIWMKIIRFLLFMSCYSSFISFYFFVWVLILPLACMFLYDFNKCVFNPM